MQTKSSYRVLKWTMLVGTAASLATACVVTTSGDGGGGAGVGDISFAGESSSTSGKTSTGGSTSEAGKTSGGSGGASTAGTAGTMAMGEAGAAYVAGLCDADGATPTMEPSCDPSANDAGKDCKICLKAKCCSDWQTCYGETPTTACGWGPTEADDGQFDCIQHCFADGAMAATNADDLLTECAGKCALQCDTPDNGNITDATNALITCANDPATCQDACFPFN